MKRRELFRRVATMAGAAAVLPAVGAQDAQAETAARTPSIELKAKGANGRSASLKLHGIDISHLCRGVIINANVDDAITAHVNMLTHDGLDVVLPEADVQINVTVYPGYALLVTEDEHGVKRFTAQREKSDDIRRS